LTILVRNCGPGIADHLPHKLYQGKYVSQLPVGRNAGLSCHGNGKRLFFSVRVAVGISSLLLSPALMFIRRADEIESPAGLALIGQQEVSPNDIFQ
jgi:hypothetical protein